MGKPTVVDYIPNKNSDISDKELLIFAASLEQGSEHPIGKSIVSFARTQSLDLIDPQNFRAHSGFGVQAQLDDQIYKFGKPGWFAKASILTDDIQKTIFELQNMGRTVMVLAREKDVLGIISVSDVLKPESKQAIAELHKENLKVIMLTGDNLQTAQAIGNEVNVDDISAEVKPEEKSGAVSTLQQNSVLVGMVGDGINDAPALAKADIGFAIGTGTDIAIETGDVILSSGKLTGIPTAIKISRKTIATIKQNLFLAFIYNIILIPVAAGILAPFDMFPLVLRQLHPILAALAMAGSSISVVTNSLRLYKADIK